MKKLIYQTLAIFVMSLLPACGAVFNLGAESKAEYPDYSFDYLGGEPLSSGEKTVGHTLNYRELEKLKWPVHPKYAVEGHYWKEDTYYQTVPITVEDEDGLEEALRWAEESSEDSFRVLISGKVVIDEPIVLPGNFIFQAKNQRGELIFIRDGKLIIDSSRDDGPFHGCSLYSKDHSYASDFWTNRSLRLDLPVELLRIQTKTAAHIVIQGYSGFKAELDLSPRHPHIVIASGMKSQIVSSSRFHLDTRFVLINSQVEFGTIPEKILAYNSSLRDNFGRALSSFEGLCLDESSAQRSLRHDNTAYEEFSEKSLKFCERDLWREFFESWELCALTL
jgi:hypothetical protein